MTPTIWSRTRSSARCVPVNATPNKARASAGSRRSFAIGFAIAAGPFAATRPRPARVDQHAAPEPVALAAWEHITATQVAEAIALLPRPFRRVDELHAMGLAYTDIARELDIPVNTVGTRLARARAKLKVILNPTGAVC